MNFPAELKYTPDHEWIRVEGNTATVGITDFAQSELGDLVYIEIETVGDTVKAGDVFGTVEAVKTTSELFMPVTGKVLEVNKIIVPSGDDNPAIINSDPYGDGWLVKIEIADLAELGTLLDVVAYQKLVH